MAGVDDFRKLSDAVVEGGNEMRSSLVGAVEAAKEMDKILDAVSKQQSRSLKIATSYRDSIKRTAGRMVELKQGAAGTRDAAKNMSSSFNAAKKPLKDLRDSIADVADGLTRLSRVDLSFAGLSSANSEMAAMAKSTNLFNKAEKDSVKVKIKLEKTEKALVRQFGLVRRHTKVLVQDYKTLNTYLKKIRTSTLRLNSVLSEAGGAKKTSFDVDVSPVDGARAMFSDLKASLDAGLASAISIDSSQVNEAKDAFLDLRKEIESGLSSGVTFDSSQIDIAKKKFEDLRALMAGIAPSSTPVPAPVAAKNSSPAPVAAKNSSPAPVAANSPSPAPVATPPPVAPSTTGSDFYKEVTKEISITSRAVKTESRTMATDMADAMRKINSSVKLKKLETMRSVFEHLDAGAKSTVDLFMKAGATFEQAFEESTKGMVEVKELMAEVEKQAQDFSKRELKFNFSDDWAKEIQKIEKKTSALRASIGKAGVSFLNRKEMKEEIVLLSQEMQKIKAFQELASGLELGDKVTLQSAKAAGKLNEEMEKLIERTAGYKDILEGQVEAAKQAAEADSSLEKAMNKHFSIIGKVNEKFEEGAAEAKRFAGGAEKTGGGMMAAGLAAAFLFKQMGEVIEKYKEAAIGLAELKVDMEALSFRTFGADASGVSFKKMRDDLSLTKQQSMAFFEVVDDGYSHGVSSIDNMVTAAKKLQNTFGGDPTKRLREYVDILKEIPTLDTDLSISASMDERSSALFALAQKGKISAVMELQAAGIAGGNKARTLASKEDVKLLNSAQKTERFVQDIRDAMLSKFFPVWGPQFSAIASNTAKLLAVVSAAVATMGAMKFFKSMGKGGFFGKGGFMAGGAGKALGSLKKGGMLRNIATKAIKMKRSVLRTGARVGAGAGAGAGAGVAGKVAGVASKAVGVAGKALGGLTGPIGWAGLGLNLLGEGAEMLGDKFEESGDKTAASLSRLSAGVLKTAGVMTTFAGIGNAILPGWGAAIGAVVGAVVGVSQNFESMGKEMESLGQTFQDTEKYSKAVQAAGALLEGFGIGVGKSGSFVNGAFHNLGISAKWVYNSLKGAVGAVKDWMIYSSKEVARRKDLASSLEKAAPAIDRITGANDLLELAMDKTQKVQQKAAWEFEAIFNKLQHDINNARKELFEFRKGLSQVTFKNLEEVGGSASEFNTAFSTMTTAVNSQFNMQKKAYEKARSTIMSSGNLDAQTRRVALDKLHKAEVDSTQEFVEGMKAASEALYTIPALIEKQLAFKISKAKFELSLEGKVIGLEELGEKFGAQIDDSLKVQEQTDEQGRKAVGLAARTQIKLAQEQGKVQAQALKGIVEGKDNSTKGLQESIGLKEKQVKGMEYNPEKMGDLTIESAEKIKESTVVSAEGKSIIPEEVWNELTDSAKKAVGEVNSITVTGYEFNKKALEDSLNSSKSEVGALTSELDGLRDSIPKKSLTLLSLALEDNKGKIDEYGKFITAQEEKRMEEGADIPAIDKSIKESRDRIAELDGVQMEISEEVEKWKESVKKTAMAQGEVDQEKINKALDAYVDSLLEGEEKQKIAIEGVNALVENGDVIAKRLAEEAANAARAITLGKKLDEAQKKSETIQSAINDGKGNFVILQEAELRRIEESAAAVRAVREQIQKIVKLNSSELDDRKRQLEVISIQSIYAAASGKAIENQVENIAKQADVYEEQINLQGVIENKMKETMKGLEHQKEGKEEELRLVGKDADRAKKLEKDIETLNGHMKASLDGLNEVRRTTAEMGQEMLNQAMDFQDIQASLEKDVRFKRVGKELDLSSSMMDLAEYSSNWKEMSRDSFKIAAEYAQKRFELEKESIESSYDEKRKSIDKKYDKDIKEAKDPKEKEDLEKGRLEAQRTLEAGKQVKLGIAETEAKKRTVDMSKKAADMARGMVDAQQQVAEGEAEFLAEVGGSWGTILDLQALSVGLERQKMDIAIQHAKEVEELLGQGPALAQAQLEARMAELSFQKKALGAQKSAYEKMMGMAFGAIRSSFGLRQNVDSAVMKMGRDGTAVKTRSGNFRGAKDGEVQTIDARAIKNQLGSAFGNEGASGESILSTPVSEILKKSGGRGVPEKTLDMSIKTAKLTEDISDSSEKNMIASQGTYDDGHVAGSIYTHDVTAEGLMTKLCGYVETAVGILQQIAGQKATSEVLPQEKAAALPQEKAAVLIKPAEGLKKDSSKEKDETFEYLSRSSSDKGFRKQVKESAKEEKKKPLEEQLAVAKKELDASASIVKQLKLNHGTEEEIKKASSVEAEAKKKVSSIEDKINKREWKNPVVGGGNVTKGESFSSEKTSASGSSLSVWKGTETTSSVASDKGQSEEGEKPSSGKVSMKFVSSAPQKDSKNVNINDYVEKNKKNLHKTSDDGFQEGVDKLKKGHWKMQQAYFDKQSAPQYSAQDIASPNFSSGSGKSVSPLIANPLAKLEDMAESGLHAGSIYTHDISVETAIMDLSSQLVSVFQRSAGGLETAPGQGVSSFAGMGQQSGTSGGTMKITGEISVKFDTKMFKAEVTKIVGEVIRNGDTRIALTRQGFNNNYV